MKPRLLTATLASLLALGMVSCAGPSHQSDAADLRDQLADLPGVTEASLDYSEPITLDSGKLELRVEMESEADPEAITKVVTTTYAALVDAHHGEEGDLDVVVDDDVIHLRSFKPAAEVDAVSKAAAAAATVLPSGSVRADINTQDVEQAPRVFTTYAVAVEKAGRDSVLETLAELEKSYGDIPDSSWSAQSGGESGWLLRADQGFPTAKELTLFDQLSNNLPPGAVIQQMGDYPIMILTPRTTLTEASAVVGRHIALLGGAKKAFYEVQGGQRTYASITHGECFFDTGAVGAQLEEDHKSGCTTVIHPEG